MSIIQGILLGILQGVAEFLPISSSGHLAIAQKLFGLDEVPLLFDIFLHLATLAAVCLYFWKKIWTLLKSLGHFFARKTIEEDSTNLKIIIAIILSTVVTGAMGIFTSKFIPDLPIKFVCAGFLLTSIFLIISAALEKRQSLKAGSNPFDAQKISVKQALIIGFMQGIGTLPGISRSGSTIAGAMMCGVNRSFAGDYSFIVSIPAILGAFVLELKDLEDVSQSIGAAPVIAGCAAAFAVGYISLSLLMKVIRKGKLQWFAAYLIPAGILGMIFLK